MVLLFLGSVFMICCFDFGFQVLMKSDDKLLPRQHHKRMQDFGVKLASLSFFNGGRGGEYLYSL